jgi:hypothetical protein
MLQALARLLVSVAALAVASPLAGAQTTTGDPDAQRKADLITWRAMPLVNWAAGPRGRPIFRGRIRAGEALAPVPRFRSS